MNAALATLMALLFLPDPASAHDTQVAAHAFHEPDMSDEDRQANEDALTHGMRIMSVYPVGER